MPLSHSVSLVESASVMYECYVCVLRLISSRHTGYFLLFSFNFISIFLSLFFVVCLSLYFLFGLVYFSLINTYKISFLTILLFFLFASLLVTEYLVKINCRFLLLHGQPIKFIWFSLLRLHLLPFL